MAKLVGIHRLALLSPDNAAAVEELLSKPERSPRGNRGVRGWSYTFLRSVADPSQLAWIVTLGTFGADHDVPSGVADLIDDVYTTAKEELEPLCYRVSYELLTSADDGPHG